MIALRWAMLAVLTWLMSAAFGAMAADLQPSAQRLAVTAIVALLALLFWPGSAATRRQTVLRIAGWSLAAAGTAAVVLRTFGAAGQPLAATLGSCAMLLALLLLMQALAAMLEMYLRGPSRPADEAREAAGFVVTILLALLGSLPLWFGPASELLSVRHDWVVDAALAVSPLTHLAVASGNDLLHNEWLYQHSNLAALPVSYPDLTPLVWSYATACSLLALGALAAGRRRRAVNDPAPTDLTQEKPR